MEVPTTMLVDTAKQVGRPKLRLPISENACPVIFRSFVHRTTSHGLGGDSGSDSGVGDTWLVIDDCREWIWARYGEPDRDTLRGDEDKRDWKRRSNGRWTGLGLTRGEPRGSNALLPCDEIMEPCDESESCFVNARPSHHSHVMMESHLGSKLSRPSSLGSH